MSSAVKEKKHRKMSRKKKVIFSILCVVVVIVATMAILFSVGAQGTTESTLPENTVNICFTPPADGSLPEDHSVTDNVGYIIGRLSRRTFYHTDSEADVSSNSMGMDVRQTILGTKDFKDGVMITSQLSISYSAFAPSKALQKFFGENSVVVRNAASGNSADWNGRDTEWDAGEPGAIYTNEEYLQVYGLPATEISDFIINEETIVSESEITYDAETQLYSLTVGLDTLTSVAYYVNNMRTMGNLPTNPEFTNVSITFRFLEDWSVVSMEIVEEYSVSMSLAITATTKGVTEVNFSYDEADVDVSDYEEYFSKYANAAPMGGEEQGMTAQDYFLNGFSSVLSGRSVFKVDATVAGEPVTGFILLDMEMGDSIAINELKVQLDGLALAYEGDALYVHYKDLTGKLAVSDITSLLGGLLGGAESGSEEGGGLNADELLGALLGGELTETDTSATLTSTLPLGSLQIPVEFGFDVTETESGKQVAWSYIDVSLEAAGMEIVLNVTPAAESDGNFAEIDTDKAVDLAAYVRDIQALIAGKDYALTLGYAADGLSLDADLRLALADGIALTGTLNVTVGSVSLPLSVTLAEDTVWLSLYGVKISATFDELEEAVAKIVALAGVELPDLGNTEADVAALVAQLLRIDYDSLIKELSLTGSELSLTVNADELLSALLGSNVALGDLSAGYTMGEGFSLEALGAKIGFAASDAEGAVVPPADKDSYVPLSKLLAFVDPVAEIIGAQSVGFTLAADVTVEGVKLNLAADGKVNFADGMQLYLTLQAKAYGADGVPGELITLRLAYADEKLYVLFGNAAAYVTADDLSRFAALFSGAEADTADALASLASSIDFNEILQAFTLFVNENDALAASFDLSVLLGEQFGNIGLTAEVRDGAVVLTLGDTSLAGVALSDAHAQLAAGDGEAAFSTDGAVNAAGYIDEIYALIAGGEYSLTADYSDPANGLLVDVDLRIRTAEGFALQGSVYVAVAGVELPLSVTVADGTVYLSLYKIRISANFDEIAAAVEKIAQLAGVQLPAEGEAGIGIDVASLVAKLLSVNYNELLGSLTLTDSELSLTVNADALLSALLGSDVTLGELSACYTMGKGFSFEAFGAELGFAASADTTAILPPEDADAYVTLSEILPFVDAIGAIADAKDIAFELSDLTVTVGGQELQFGLQGEVWLADEGVYLWLAFTYADETIQIYYNNDEVQIVYAGYKMHVPASDLELFRNEIGKLLGDVSGEVADADASAFMSLLSELDLQALIESVELAAEEGGLRFAADIASLIGAQESTPLSVSLGADASSLSIELNGGITLFGVTVNSFGASVWTAENALPELSGTDCKNVFAFILNAYSEFTGSEYMTMTVTLTSPFTATLAGAVQFEKSAEEGDSTVTLNMAFDAVFTDANNENHYIGITVYRDTVYLYYSMIGFAESHYFTPTDDANLDPLRVSLSVSALFDAAQTVLPIVTPLLGLEDSAAYYFDFVYEILGGAYTTINSDIFSVMNTQEWLELVLGIIDEHTGSGAETSAQDAGASQAAEIAFDLGELKLSVSMNGVAIDIAAGSAYYNAENALSAPTDGAYTDISWISQLMQDVLTAYDYYEDGRGYYLSGSLGIDIIGIELDLTIGFELRIGFDEQNVPYIYIRLTAAEYSNGLLALIPNLWSSTVIPCDTSTEIVVYDGDVYIARTTADSVKSETVSVKFNDQQQENYWFSKRTYNYYDVTTRSYYTEYRAMTSDSFFADIMDQLIWAVNIDSKLATFIMDMIPAEGESGGTVTRTDDINDMVNSYSGNESGYSVTLDLGKILMEDTLGAVSLNITRTQRADGKYDLTSASLEMTLASVITVKTKDGGITNHIMAEGETSQAEEYCKQIMDTVSSAGAAVPDAGYALFYGNYTDAVATGQRYWVDEDPYYSLFGSSADNLGQTYSYTLTGGAPQYIVS